MKKKDLFTPREKLVPAEYPEFQKAWEAAIGSHWTHKEISMINDIIDWNSGKLSEGDKSAIAGILRGFTIAEQRIGCYWRDLVAKSFPKPEIQAMAVAFSAMESIHGAAYNHLEETLGLDTYEAFLEDVTAQNKLAKYVCPIGGIQDKKDLALSLVVFSGAGEGISLFGSFAILLDFCRRGYLNGVKQILSYSARDELNHSNSGLELYNCLISEYPEAKPDDSVIIEALEERLRAELDFVKNAFNVGEKINISLEEVEIFLRRRKYQILKKINVKIEKPKEKDPIGDWFYPLVNQSTLQDFFTSGRNGSAYATSLTQDFKTLNYGDLL